MPRGGASASSSAAAAAPTPATAPADGSPAPPAHRGATNWPDGTAKSAYVVTAEAAKSGASMLAKDLMAIDREHAHEIELRPKQTKAAQT